MVICAAQVVEHLNTVGTGTRYLSTSETAEGVAAIYGVNRATGETSGLSIYDDVSTATAAECDNNNGAFLVNLTPDGYSIGFLIGSEQDGDLATVTDVDGLMAAFGACWSPMPYDVERQEREWAVTVSQAVETLRAAETAGHLMDQDTATRVASATARGWKTTTVWDHYTSARPSYTSATGATVTVLLTDQEPDGVSGLGQVDQERPVVVVAVGRVGGGLVHVEGEPGHLGGGAVDAVDGGHPLGLQTARTVVGARREGVQVLDHLGGADDHVGAVAPLVVTAHAVTGGRAVLGGGGLGGNENLGALSHGVLLWSRCVGPCAPPTRTTIHYK